MDKNAQTTPAPTWFLDEHIDDLDGTEPFVIRCRNNRLNQTLPLATVHQWEGQTREEAKANAEFIVRACNSHADLLKLAELFSGTCGTRLSLLRDDLNEDFGDPDDIQDQIDHWQALKNESDTVFAKAYGKPA